MSLQVILLIAISIIHIIASRLRFLQGFPRSVWLSIAGGASVAYVFLFLIPELIEAREYIAIMEHELSVFVIALIGLCFIYGLEKIAKSRSSEDVDQVFWIHISSYSLYNFIIGYLLVSRPEEGYMSHILFFIAMALHFLVNDYGLLEHHRSRYLRIGRWWLAGAVMAGGITSVLWKVPDEIIYGGIAFISGGIIMNILKEELPEQRESRYWAFLLGAALYSTLLFFLTHIS